MRRAAAAPYLLVIWSLHRVGCARVRPCAHTQVYLLPVKDKHAQYYDASEDQCARRSFILVLVTIILLMGTAKGTNIPAPGYGIAVICIILTLISCRVLAFHLIDSVDTKAFFVKME